MPRSPYARACIWFCYTFLIAEFLPFAILWRFANDSDEPEKVLESYLGLTTMVLLGYGVLVAATGDRLIESGFSRALVQPLMWVSCLLGLATYFLYKQYIASVKVEKPELIVTSALGIVALLAAVYIKFEDWQQSHSFSK